MRCCHVVLVFAAGCFLITTPLAAAGADTTADERLLKDARLGTDGPALLEFFRKRTLTEFDKDKLATLVMQLGDKAPEVREKAFGELLSLGSLAVPMLRLAARDPDDQEVSSQAKRCLQFLEGSAGPAIPAAAARLVVQRRPEGAAEALLAYLPFADNDTVIDEVTSALAVVAVRDGKPDKALISALEDKVPIRRAVAAEALCQAHGGEAVPSVIKLLQDPKPVVRLRAAIALANFREAKAVSTLIALLTELPVAQAMTAENYLVGLAGELAPKVPLGTSDVSRQKCRDAWAAWWQATEGDGSLAEFRKRTLTDELRTKISTLVKQLGDDTFETREKAAKELVSLGGAAAPALRQAAGSSDLEVSDRAKKCLVLIEKEKSTALPTAAVRIVALRKPAGAAEALLAFLPFADDESIAGEVLSALVAVGVREGKADPALVKGLEDKVPVRRIAAAEALCQAGVADQFPTVRKLLADPDPAVQFRVAMALAAAQDRETIPPLINLLGSLPPELGGQIEEYLRQLAGDKAPTVNLGADKAAKEKCRDAWVAWWKDNGAQVNLAKPAGGAGRLGYTLVVQRDKTGTAGRVVELDANGKVRWEIAGLQSPIDAQVLPGNRVLICEYTPKRVTERNLKGEVLWERKLAANQYLVGAHRLPNGNTFIASRNQLVEVDRDGKEVFIYNYPNGTIYAAQRLSDGQIVFLTNTGICTRLDAKGKEVKSFQSGRIALYGSFDVLPNGNVLVPISTENKVVEFDAAGKRVWEVAATAPSSATRLPNGNTLIASPTGMRLVEVDRAGKEVWVKQIDGRPYQATRR